MEMQVVNIHIFGRTIKLKCPVDEVDALNLAAQDLDDRLNQLKLKTQIMNGDQLIMSAALNISYELSKEKEKTRKLNDELNNRLINLQKLLDNALNTDNQ